MDSFNRCSNSGDDLASVYILRTGLVQNAPVLINCFECCPIVAVWNLDHTQYNYLPLPSQPKELHRLLGWEQCVTNPDRRNLWTLVYVSVKFTSLHSWAANLNPFHVTFTVYCKWLPMASNERLLKQVARSSTRSALKMFLAIREGRSSILSPKHVTPRTSHVGQLSWWTTCLMFPCKGIPETLFQTK